MAQPISFFDRDVERALAARTSVESQAARSQTAKRDLDRYYALLARSLPTFSQPEASILCDVANGTLFEPHTMMLLWANVADAEQDGIAQKWQITAEQFAAFVARLRRLSYAECVAVVDACERAWHLMSVSEPQMPLREVLVAVGLIQGERL